MTHRRSFSRREADEIKGILREKSTAGTNEQKTLRGRLRRKYEFHIEDFSSDADGFTVLDFDALVESRAILLEEEGPDGLPRIEGVDYSILDTDEPS